MIDDCARLPSLLAIALVAVWGCGPTGIPGTYDAEVGQPDGSNQSDGNATTPDAATADADPDQPDAGALDAAAVDAVPPDADPPDANPLIPPDVIALYSDDGSLAGGEQVVISGGNFSADITVSFGGALTPCTFNSLTMVTCTTLTAAVAGSVDVTATQASGSDTLVDGFTFWDTASAIDDCDILAPVNVDELATRPHTFSAQVYEIGITNTTTGNDPTPDMRLEYGIGPAGTDPRTAPGWTWLQSIPTPGYGPGSGSYQVNWDEYQYAGMTPTRGKYAWSYRAGLAADDWASWMICGTGAITARSPITCDANSDCFSDEMCLWDCCRLPCDTASDCLSWGPACSGIAQWTDETTWQLYCSTENPGGGALGADCTADSQCESNQCLIDITDTCTLGCGLSDALCAGTPNQICTSFSGLGLCVPSCDHDNDCDTAGGKLCTVNTNTDQNPDRIDLICSVPDVGSDPPGSDCSVSNNCDSGLCVDNGVVEVCTTVCGGGPCPGAVPNCGTATATLPDGGTQDILLCLP